jgi:hypothetical protein
MPIEILPNPAFAGREPRLLQPVCHDRTPMLDYACGCGATSHMHESQLDGLTDLATILFRCHACGVREPIPVEQVRRAFADMRAAGWYA